MALDTTYVARNVSISDTFRDYAEEKFTKINQLTEGALRLEVKVTKQSSHRGPDGEMTVELTLHGKNRVVRAESSDDDKTVAFDKAFTRIQERLRRLRERRKGVRRRHSVADVTAELPPVDSGTSLVDQVLQSRQLEEQDAAAEERQKSNGNVPVSIREKVFPTVAMTVDDAVDNMELVGHDFYLFVDSETQRPSAVYRRRGWSYGVISLGDDVEETKESERGYREGAPVS